MLLTTIRFYCRYPKQLARKLACVLLGKENKHLEVEDFLPLLPANPVIFEAGASRGMDTVKFAKLWPEAQIFAFEPEPTTFAVLTQETEAFANVQRFQLALAEQTGTAAFHVSSRSDNANATDASSLLKPLEIAKDLFNMDFSNQVTVQAVTLADFMREREVDHIDLMWLDMQGMEINCLMASKEALGHVDRIYMEVSLHPLYEGAPLYPAACKAMESVGFSPVKEFLNPFQGDVLFERRIKKRSIGNLAFSKAR